LLSATGVQEALQGQRWSFDPATDDPTATEIRPGVWKMTGSGTGDRMDSEWWSHSSSAKALARQGLPIVMASPFAFPTWADGPLGRAVAQGLPPGAMRVWTL